MTRRWICCAIWLLASLPAVARAAPPSSVEQLPVRGPEPPKGKAMYGWGVFGVTFGIVNIGYGIPLSIEGPGDAFFSGAVPMAFGAGFVVLGSLGVHYGKRRKAAWYAWAGQEMPRPRPGVPALIAGGTSTGIGIATLIPALYVLPWQELGGKIAAGIGGAAFLAGATLLTVGAFRLTMHRETRRPVSRLQLAPTPWIGAQIGLGVAGRF